jgi:hypothetical protein
MITYVYWFLLSVLALGLVMGLGNRFGLWKGGMIAAVTVMVVGALAYFLYFEQMFVKRYGGTMTVSSTEGRLHLGSTWKDDNLWVESWDPQSNVCYFEEFARSGILEGSVVIKDCNPLQARISLPVVGAPASP